MYMMQEPSSVHPDNNTFTLPISPNIDVFWKHLKYCAVKTSFSKRSVFKYSLIPHHQTEKYTVML